MQTTHFWHQLHLRRAKVIVLSLLLLCVVAKSNGQGYFGLTNNPGSDEKLVSYGFFLSVPVCKMRCARKLLRRLRDSFPRRSIAEQAKRRARDATLQWSVRPCAYTCNAMHIISGINIH